MYQKFDTLSENYAPLIEQQQTLKSKWWQQPTPTFENTRFGGRSHPLNIQWQGDIDNIKSSLILQDWQTMPEPSFLTFLSRLVEPNTPLRFSLLARLYQNLPPEVVFYKIPSDNKDLPFLVLRLWKAPLQFSDSTLPLWYGRLSWQYHIKPRFLGFGKTIHNKHKNPLPLLTTQLHGYHWKFMQAHGKQRSVKLLLIKQN